MNRKGMHSENTFLAKLLGVDPTFLFACPLSEAHNYGIVQRQQCYDLTCEDANTWPGTHQKQAAH